MMSVSVISPFPSRFFALLDAVAVAQLARRRRNEPLPSSEPLTDLDLSVRFRPRRDRLEPRAPVHDPENAGLPVHGADRGGGHYDPRPAGLPLRGLARKRDPRREVRKD